MSMESEFPKGWIEQLKPLLGDELPDFLDSLASPPLRGIRMRPGRPRVSEAEEKIPWVENAWYLPLSSQAGAMPLHEAGAYYLQEPSAMIPAAALNPQPGERVLDLCAAPGGKSTQMGAAMAGRGLLVCNEPVYSRAQVLSRNLERMGITNALCVSALPEELSGRWAGFFDRVLVDAPCSGEGMFRRHPETRLEWNENAPQGCAQRQSQILDHASRMLRPGGMLAYSTCTFNPIENEGVIQGFLTRHPGFSLAPFSLPGLPQNDGMLHIWPHRVKGEGHFVALMKKAEDGERACPPREERLPAPDKAALSLAEAFLREHMEQAPIPNAVFAGRLVCAPSGMPPIKGVKILRVGLQLGEIKGKVFVPDHALAMAVPCKRILPVSQAEARAYQAGETLPAPEGMKGFCTLSLEGLALGWGKVSDGQAKNHYPKGLRRGGIRE